MSRSAKRILGRCVLAAAAAVVALAVAQVRVQAAVDAFLRIEGLDGGSKDPAHTGWIEITRVVAGDLNGDVTADREASQPPMSELTVRKAGRHRPGGYDRVGNERCRGWKDDSK